MYDLDELDQAWNEYFQLDQITPPEYNEEEEDSRRYSKCPACGYYAFNGVECFDCGYQR